MTNPKVRFKQKNGYDYPPVQPSPLYEYLEVNTDRNKAHTYDQNDVLSVSGDYGVVNQIEFQGRSFAGADVGDYHVLYNGDIVYTKSPLKENPFGIIKFNKGPTGIVSTLYVVYHCKNNVDGRFVEYYFDLKFRLNNYLKPLVNIGAKHDMKISAEKAIDGLVAFPCFEEQQEIADFLSSVDDVIAVSDAEIQNLEMQKKAVLKKIFSQEVRFKRVDGTDFPKWEKMRLGECFSFKNGINASRDAFRSDGIKCIGVSDVYRCMPLLSENINGTVALNKKEATRYVVEYGDILFQRSSETFEDIGHASVYVDNEMAVFNGFVICAKPNSVFYNPYYIHYAMQSDDIRAQTVRLGAGAQHYNIGQDSLSSLVLLLPSLEEQDLIADFFSAFDDAITAAKKELELWKELKKGLLQQMFV